MLGLAIALALLIGILLGMLGGGGSILTLPMLVYVLGVESHRAIAMSLAVVGTTSLVAMVMHARKGAVQWRVGFPFSAAAMVGAYAGGSVGRHLPASVLLVAFAALMVTTSTLMLRGRKQPEAQTPARLPIMLGLGGVVGVLSGLVGAGGGFLIVPALSLFGGLQMRIAIGTSLLIISMQSAAGFLGHAEQLDLPLLASIVAAAVVGSLLGSTLSSRVPAAQLRRGFAWFVAAMGIFMFFKQLPLAFAVATSVAVLAVLGIAARRTPSPQALKEND
jgi:uncharacterized protein